MLQVSGRLASSIAPSYGPSFAAAGTNVVYATTQQLGARRGAFGTTSRGAPIPWGDIPARHFVGLSHHTELDILGLVSRYLLP